MSNPSWKEQFTLTITDTDVCGRDAKFVLPAEASADLFLNAAKAVARKAQIPTLSAADCGIDPERAGLKGSPTKVKKSFTPPRKEGGLRIKEETPEESAKKLYDLLRDKGVI